MDKSPRQRLDKWLWHARFGRTRTLAAKSVQAGNIRLNKVKITKPAHAVAIGDVLTIYNGHQIRVIRVTGMADRRGSPELAAGLYDDLTPDAAAGTGATAHAAHQPTPQPNGGAPAALTEPYIQNRTGWPVGEAHSPA